MKVLKFLLLFILIVIICSGSIFAIRVHNLHNTTSCLYQKAHMSDKNIQAQLSYIPVCNIFGGFRQRQCLDGECFCADKHGKIYAKASSNHLFYTCKDLTLSDKVYLFTWTTSNKLLSKLNDIMS